MEFLESFLVEVCAEQLRLPEKVSGLWSNSMIKLRQSKKKKFKITPENLIRAYSKNRLRRIMWWSL